MGEHREISEGEAALVFRRAAEIDATRHPGLGNLLDEPTMLEIARDAGLSDSAMRQALTELRHGMLDAAPRARVLAPGMVTAQRTVRSPLGDVARQVRGALGQQLFTPIRDRDTVMVFTRRADVAANVSRGFKKPPLRAARAIEASLTDLGDGRTDVLLRADLRPLRTSALVGMGAGGAEAAAGSVVGVTLGIVVSPVLLVIVPPSLLVGAATAMAARSAFNRRAERTLLALEGVLDRIDRIDRAVR